MAATVPTTIDVASTTSAFPFVQRWAAQYENQQLASLDKINVVYLDEGQLDGANGAVLANWRLLVFLMRTMPCTFP